MSNAVAVIGLVWWSPVDDVWNSIDIQRSDLDLHFEITEGLDTLPIIRGADQVIPFRRGRMALPRSGDHRPIIATGWVAGSGSTPRAKYRTYVDALKTRLDPTGEPGILVATLEDASVRWIGASARNVLPGAGIGGEFSAMSIEWDALDPYWYGAVGASNLDDGLLLDDGEVLDQGAEVVVVPTSTSEALEIDTQCTAIVERVRVRLTGPSLSDPGFSVLIGGSDVGFRRAGALAAGEELVVDNFARTAFIGSELARADMTLAGGNRHGEYVRLAPGVNAVRVLGQPAEARILFHPTFN